MIGGDWGACPLLKVLSALSSKSVRRRPVGQYRGPLIRANWTVKVTDERTNELIRYETVAPPGLTTYWEIYFTPGAVAGETEVHEAMRMPFGMPRRAALAVIGKLPAEEVSSNLRRLKEVVETGRATDTSHAVAGKFSQHQS